MMEDSNRDWIDEAIRVFDKNNSIAVANPTWNRKYDDARSECEYEDDEWFYGKGLLRRMLPRADPHFSTACLCGKKHSV